MELVETQAILQLYKQELDLKDKIINTDALKIDVLKQNILAEQEKSDLLGSFLAREQRKSERLEKGVKIFKGTSALLAVGLLISLLKH